EDRCNLAFISGGAWVIGDTPYGGVNVSIYEQQETTVVSELLAFCASNHKHHPMIKTTVRIFSSAHIAENEVLVAELELPAQG
ncbi:MAG: hypothetical protein LPK85_02570, partial [Gammaproteobacteria bacterium]|nr:hypothetical protein [Gammaproteobacteria bacterium]